MSGMYTVEFYFLRIFRHTRQSHHQNDNVGNNDNDVFSAHSNANSNFPSLSSTVNSQQPVAAIKTKPSKAKREEVSAQGMSCKVSKSCWNLLLVATLSSSARGNFNLTCLCLICIRNGKLMHASQIGVQLLLISRPFCGILGFACSIFLRWGSYSLHWLVKHNVNHWFRKLSNASSNKPRASSLKTSSPSGVRMHSAASSRRSMVSILSKVSRLDI